MKVILFIDILANKPSEREKAFEAFNEIKTLNTLIINTIKQQ